MQPSAIRSTAPSPQRALVVDDEESIRRVLRRFLERAGWTVDEAKDGFEARSRLDDPRSDAAFDIVICDLNLPDCSGLDLRRIVAERSSRLTDRFVLATGEGAAWSGEAHGEDVGELAAGGRLLSKPFSLEELSALLHRVAPTAAAA